MLKSESHLKLFFLLHIKLKILHIHSGLRLLQWQVLEGKLEERGELLSLYLPSSLWHENALGVMEKYEQRDIHQQQAHGSGEEESTKGDLEIPVARWTAS
jgi:hypothetical protein